MVSSASRENRVYKKIHKRRYRRRSLGCVLAPLVRNFGYATALEHNSHSVNTWRNRLCNYCCSDDCSDGRIHNCAVWLVLLLLGGELLTERCRTDDLMPDLPVPSLPPCSVDPKVLGLDVLIDRSEPGGSWASNGSPPVRRRTQSGGDDTVMIFLLG